MNVTDTWSGKGHKRIGRSTTRGGATTEKGKKWVTNRWCLPFLLYSVREVQAREAKYVRSLETIITRGERIQSEQNKARSSNKCFQKSHPADEDARVRHKEEQRPSKCAGCSTVAGQICFRERFRHVHVTRRNHRATVRRHRSDLQPLPITFPRTEPRKRGAREQDMYGKQKVCKRKWLRLCM